MTPESPLKHKCLLMCVFANQLITIFAVTVAAVVSTYVLARYYSGQSDPKSKVNQTINKDSPKVVHSFDVEDIGNKVAYCRCWRSKKVSESTALWEFNYYIFLW